MLLPERLPVYENVCDDECHVRLHHHAQLSRRAAGGLRDAQFESFQREEVGLNSILGHPSTSSSFWFLLLQYFCFKVQARTTL